MQHIKHFLFFILFFVFSFAFAIEASAATLFLVPGNENLAINEEFTVDIKINTNTTSINAAQATITFSNDKLELVEIEKIGSVFNFWVKEPEISNENGTIEFIGGTPVGISGSSLHILKMKFQAIDTGIAEINISDAVVTASDGKGTNVLSNIIDLNIYIETPITKPAILPPFTDIPTETPELVKRPVVITGTLLQKPILEVPLYSDQSKWYDHVNGTIVLWDVPNDVIKIATAFDKSPNTIPQTIEEELMTGKNFGPIQDGIWYVHVQFKNNVGWGKTAHYKISLDTTPPLPIEINIDKTAVNNPSPRIEFEVQDNLSGISKILVSVDGKNPEIVTGMQFTPPPLPPGKHTILIKAFDNAGNSVEDSIEFEILPLPTPIIDFVTKTLHPEEPGFIHGITTPDNIVIVKILDNKNREVFVKEVRSNMLGQWDIVIDEIFKTGKYTITATAKNEIGALSYPTEERKFKVNPTTILSVGSIEIGWIEMLLFLILFGISGSAFIAKYLVSEQSRRKAYISIACKDIDKLSTLIEKDIENIEKIKDGGAKKTVKTKTEVEFFIRRIRENVAKMKKYVSAEVRKSE